MPHRATAPYPFIIASIGEAAGRTGRTMEDAMTRFPMMRTVARRSLAAAVFLAVVAALSPSQAIEFEASPMLEQVAQCAAPGQAQSVRRVLERAEAEKPDTVLSSMSAPRTSQATARRN